MAFPTITVTPGIGQTINTLPGSGQTTMGNSLPIVIASDQPAIPTITPVGATTWAVTQVTIGTTATSLLAARAGRFGVLITNLGTTAVFLGIAGVTTVNGALLPGVVGASKTIPVTGAVFGIVASGSQIVSVEEYF
jgi:hypothetical protein